MAIPAWFVLFINILLVKVQFTFFLGEKQTKKDNKDKLYCVDFRLILLGPLYLIFLFVE